MSLEELSLQDMLYVMELKCLLSIQDIFIKLCLHHSLLFHSPLFWPPTVFQCSQTHSLVPLTDLHCLCVPVQTPSDLSDLCGGNSVKEKEQSQICLSMEVSSQASGQRTE